MNYLDYLKKSKEPEPVYGTVFNYKMSSDYERCLTEESAELSKKSEP